MSKIGLEFVFKTETVNKIALLRNVPVSYTHLTLPTNREV